MTIPEDEEDETLAQFLEWEVLSEEISDQEEAKTGEEEEGPRRKRLRGEEKDENDDVGKAIVLSSSALIRSQSSRNNYNNNDKIIVGSSGSRNQTRRIETGFFSKVPPELFPHILKFLSSEDLVACSLVCRFMNDAASDESLWRRLYCLRWGLLPPKKVREFAWQKLYIQRDEEDMVEFVRTCPPEFKEYYLQMQVAKRSQTPLPSQVNDDWIILDKTIADQVCMWKSSRGLTDIVVLDHECSGETCSYYQIGNVFVCEKTGQVHVCDETCKEVVTDPTNELLVCTISGHCFDQLLSPDEMEPEDLEQQQGVTDEAEPFMGSGRFARAYLLGYNCADEKELEDCLRFC